VEVDIVQSEVAPKRGWGYVFRPLNIIFLILVFIIVFITLYASKMNMVTNLEVGERVINNRKLILWSIIITIVVAIAGFIIMSAVAKRRR
jgi:magnesium-transporting ATPase (P-type)